MTSVNKTRLNNRIWAVQLFAGWWSWLPDDIRAIQRHHFSQLLQTEANDEKLFDYVEKLHAQKVEAYGDDWVTANPLPTIWIDSVYDNDALGHPVIESDASPEDREAFDGMMAETLDHQRVFDFMPSFKDYETQYGQVFPFHDYQSLPLCAIYHKLSNALAQ